MRENRPSGSEGGVAFGPSLPLSGPFVNPPWKKDAKEVFTSAVFLLQMPGSSPVNRLMQHMQPTRLGLLLAAGLTLLVTSQSQAENWPAWRGPRGDGSSLETQLPTRWSATENVVWKTAIAGLGHSSPVLWGERLFLTTALPETQERRLLSFERKTGQVLWQ